MNFLHPNEFTKLKDEEKQTHFMKIFIENNGETFIDKCFDNTTYKYVYSPYYKVSRKFKKEQGDICEKEMDEIILKYENDKLVFRKTTMKEDYFKIYNIHSRLCMDCGKDTMCFGYGDKSFTYMCNTIICKPHFEKEFFHRHGRQYLYD